MHLAGGIANGLGSLRAWSLAAPFTAQIFSISILVIHFALNHESSREWYLVTSARGCFSILVALKLCADVVKTRASQNIIFSRLHFAAQVCKTVGNAMPELPRASASNLAILPELWCSDFGGRTHRATSCGGGLRGFGCQHTFCSQSLERCLF